MLHYHILTIFPELFDSFFTTSLLGKAKEKWVLSFSVTDIRTFATDKHRQVDDEPYGGGPGLLMKAQPIIDAIKSLQQNLKNKQLTVIMPAPSEEHFTQSLAHTFAENSTDIVFICGRYEGIDHRVELRCKKEFWQNFYRLSVGQYVTMGGELPVMLMIEAISRLLPGVIQETESRQVESYRPEQGGENIEYAQYTRPQTVEGFDVPEVLLSGHHEQIAKRRATLPDRSDWLAGRQKK